MNNSLFNEVSLTDFVNLSFEVNLSVSEIITNKELVSRSDLATVFMTDKNKLYALVQPKSKKLLDDIRKIVQKMNLVPYDFIPPVGEPNYFVDIATKHFKKTFPGRRINNESDLVFYKRLAPYTPALVQVKSVRNGEIKCFDSDARGSWRTCKKLVYNKITDF